MRCIIQRVNRASIVINGKSGGQIGKGLLVLCAFSDGDDGSAEITVMLEVKSSDQVEDVIKKLKTLPEVIDVHR